MTPNNIKRLKNIVKSVRRFQNCKWHIQKQLYFHSVTIFWFWKLDRDWKMNIFSALFSQNIDIPMLPNRMLSIWFGYSYPIREQNYLTSFNFSIQWQEHIISSITIHFFDQILPFWVKYGLSLRPFCLQSASSINQSEIRGWVVEKIP